MLLIGYNGDGTPSGLTYTSAIKEANAAIIQCSGYSLHDWGELNNQCPSSVQAGQTCQPGDRCFRYMGGINEFRPFCDTGNYTAGQCIDYDGCNAWKGREQRLDITARRVKVIDFYCN